MDLNIQEIIFLFGEKTEEETVTELLELI